MAVPHGLFRRALLGGVLAAFLLATIAYGGQRPARPSTAAEPSATSSLYLPLVHGPQPYVDEGLTTATYHSILAMIEPGTGLPHDRFDASIYDIAPQLARLRQLPSTTVAPGAQLESKRCNDPECRVSGDYGLKFSYTMPAGTFGSYNFNSPGIDASRATHLEVWTRGARGGERLELVLWSNCQGNFPGRPESALLTTTASWTRHRIPLADFAPHADIGSLCRVSIGFNDAIHPGGTLYLDSLAFVDANGSRVDVPLDEATNVTNIGLYIASVLAARKLGLEREQDVVSKLATTLSSIERLQKLRGFPLTHNHVISLRPAEGASCEQPDNEQAPGRGVFVSTVDLGNLAAGLTVLRNGVPALAARADALLDAMEWDWLYDPAAGLLYGCRYPDGSASAWHYDWLAADSYTAYAIATDSGEVPATAWDNLNRSHEAPRCANSNRWHYEPGWDGGGLFMQLLPIIFLERAQRELGDSARNFVLDQICYATQIRAPAWGQSATALPPHGEKYYGYGELRDDVLVPHASLLAVEYVHPTKLTENVAAFRALGARQPVTDDSTTVDFGFRSSLYWETGEVSTVYLVLDQSMTFLSLSNAATGGYIRTLFGSGK